LSKRSQKLNTQPSSLPIGTTKAAKPLSNPSPPKLRRQPCPDNSRATFDFVLNNPGKTRKEILNALAAQGYKQGSTSSLIGQFTKQGYIVNRDGFMFAQQAEYKPLKTSQRKAAQTPAPKAAPKASPKATPKAAPKPKAKPEPAPQINAAWDAETLLNNLSIKQARALYDELRKIFGG
jgi:hypothetical protein